MNTTTQSQSQSQKTTHRNTSASAASTQEMAFGTPFEHYNLSGSFDEMFNKVDGPRPHYNMLFSQLQELPLEQLERRQLAADRIFLNHGITFTVYSDDKGTERIFPYDLLPRIITKAEWSRLEEGLSQRITALNLFIHDIYHDQKVLKDKIIPRELVESCHHFRSEMMGVDVPGDVYLSIVGSDLIRLTDGAFAVLEDNLRVPSGVSYMLANRQIMKRVFPDIFRKYGVRSISHYSRLLLSKLQKLSPRPQDEPNIVLLTPGAYNSAYFEHTFLAREMGIALVEGRDLEIQDDIVYMRTTAGRRRVDVIYRRIDDDFLDPEAFRKDSLLGVPGLFNAYKGGNVALSNAIGTGFADDKAVYAYVPDLIKYYLDQDSIIPNVETFLLEDDTQRKHVTTNIDKLVVKAVGESGGYGILIGPHSTKKQQSDFCKQIEKNPRNYIAQPTIDLSRVPCFVEGQLEPRHVDLRPFILNGTDGVDIVPGGLTRVALTRGSLVVNSSQGGGSKDTWVLNK